LYGRSPSPGSESKREKESSSFTPEIFSKGNSEKETLCIWDTIPEARDPAQTWNISALSEQEQKQVKTVFEKTSQISNKEREIVQENGATLQQQSPSLTSSDFPLPSFIDPNVVQVNTDKNITIEEDQFYLEPIE